mgnify:CR=1 FL=1
MRKSKVLLSASALLALFAACNNELEMPANIETGIANRPSAGKVVITPVVGEDADTRAEWNSEKGKWQWQPNDRFGVMLMDEWNQTNEGNTSIADYTFTDYIHTNYPFSTQDGYLWSSPDNAAVCEGNYFFVYPYDAAYKQRGYVGFHVSNKQTQQDPTDPSTPVRDYQKYMGYAFIPAANEDVNNVDVAFHPIFATPKFKLQNISGMSLRLIKLVVRTHQHGLDESPLLMPDSLVLAPLSRNFVEKASKYPEMSLGPTGDQTAYLFSHATLVQNGFYAQEPARGSKITSNPQDGVYEYTLDFGSDYIVENGEFFRACLVMPAGEYGNFDVFAFVEEQNSEKTTGVVKFTATVNSHWTGMDTQNGAMQTLLKPGHTQVFSASFDSQAIQNLGVKDFTVVSSEDLAWIIDLKAKNGGKDLVTIKTLGDQVELTKEVYDLISASNRKGIKWQIDGTIVIPETAEVDAIDQLTTGTTAKTTIINKANQELTKNLVNCDVVNYGTIKEGEGKVITIYGDVTVKAGQIVVSTVEGDLTVEAGATATVGTVTGEVQNEGKVSIITVNSNVINSGEATIETVVGDINNSGILVINNVKGVLTNTGNVTAKGGTLAEVNNEGQIDIVGNSTLPKLNANNGTINVKADTKVSGENYATINVENATLNCNANSTTPNFYNQATGIINVINGDLSQLEKKGYIINNGQIFVIGKSHVVVAKGSDNESGIIDITEANVEGSYQAKVSDAENNNQFFRYRGSVDKATLEKLISSHNFGTTPVILVFEETTTQNADLNGAAVRKLLVKKGVTLTISGNFWLEDQKLNAGIGNAYHSIEVEEGATMQVINGTTLDVKTTLTNAIVNGLLRVENTAVVKGTVTVKGTGKVENASADNNFTWTRGSSELQWWK